jgi:uncharacterized protein
MNKPLMPKATALWLLENTRLTFDQIAVFCGFHPLEIEALMNDLKGTLQPADPIFYQQLTRKEIERCENDPSAILQLCAPLISVARRKSKYTPLSKRSDIPSAILYLIKLAPQITDAQVCKLLSTTKNTVKSIREGTRAHFKELTPKDPVLLGLCTPEDLEKALFMFKSPDEEHSHL